MKPYRTTYRLGAGHLVFTIASLNVARDDANFACLQFLSAVSYKTWVKTAE